MILHNTVAAVMKKEGKFLLIKKAKKMCDAGEWAFPGGHVDKGEDILNAAKREAKEEVGNVEITEKNPFFVFIHDALKSKEGPHKHNCHVFKGKASGELRPASDVEDFGWFSKQDVLNNPKVQEWTKEIILKKF